MRQMKLPRVGIPVDAEEAASLYNARLAGALRIPTALSQLLLAYLAWPNDELARNRWMAVTNARRLTHGGRIVEPHALSLFGGLDHVAQEALQVFSARISEVSTKWTAVADLTQTVVDLHYSKGLPPKGASISKAMALCADEASAPSEGQLRRYWSEFRDVSHVIAAGAALALKGPLRYRNIFSAVWYAPDGVLAFSAGFQAFGLGYKPHGQKDSLLSRNTTWRIPAHCFPAEPWLVNRKLSDRQKELLATYRAAKPPPRK